VIGPFAFRPLLLLLRALRRKHELKCQERIKEPCCALYHKHKNGRIINTRSWFNCFNYVSFNELDLVIHSITMPYITETSGSGFKSCSHNMIPTRRNPWKTPKTSITYVQRFEVGWRLRGLSVHMRSNAPHAVTHLTFKSILIRWPVKSIAYKVFI
jgi:hypothetical protein